MFRRIIDGAFDILLGPEASPTGVPAEYRLLFACKTTVRLPTAHPMSSLLGALGGGGLTSCFPADPCNKSEKLLKRHRFGARAFPLSRNKYYFLHEFV